jgi:hypothetical protein
VVSGGVSLPGSIVEDEWRAGCCQPLFVAGRNDSDLTGRVGIGGLFAGVRRQVVFGFATAVDGTGGNRLNPGWFLYEDASMGIPNQTEGQPGRGPAMARAEKYVAIRAKTSFKAGLAVTIAWFQANRQLSLGV